MAENVQYILSLKDLLSDKIKEIQNNSEKLNNKMGDLQSSINKVGAAIGIAFGVQQIKEFIGGIINAGTTVEDATTGLTTLLGNSADAAQVVQNTMEDATKTPFEFTGLLSANQQLIAAGVNSKTAREDVLNLANAIAASGKGNDEFQRMSANLAQIRTVGQATAGDIRQFGMAGINIYKLLADTTGKNVDEVKEMDVSYDMLALAFKKAHEAGGLYAGGLENMSQNTSVQISNLGDAMFQLKNKMFEDLKPAITSIVSGLSGLIDMLSGAWDWLTKNKDIVIGVAAALGTLALAYGGLTIAAKINTWWQGANAIAMLYTIATTEGAAAAFSYLKAVMLANPFGLVVVALAAVVGGIVYAYNHFVKFRAVVIGVWGTLKEFGTMVKDFFTGLKDLMVGAITIDPKLIASGLLKTTDAFQDAGSKLASAYNKGYDQTMVEFQKEEKKKGAKPALKPGGTIETKGGAIVEDGKATKDVSPKGATGQKVTTINISINKLIEQFKIQTTNMTEGSAKVKEKVAESIMSALRDSQITAGI